MNYTIGGCSVPFPHQAYGTQLSFMGKVISALENGQNALLEAPTGSGKTLSLLCSALAWQKRERARREEYVHQSIAAQERRLAQDDAALGHTPEPEVKAIGSPGPEFQVHLPGASSGTSDILDGTSSPLKPAKTHPSPMPDLGGGGFVPGEPAHDPLGAPLRTKVPRIYYATRTHSQIAQVVKELKRSGHHPRMAVLAAKQHYCVNSHAKVQPSLEEACDDLLKDGNCAYFRGVQSMLNSDAAWLVHDIEDLSKMGKSRKACPYYVSRRWAAEAELVFGPYSYLVDPVIRRSLGIGENPEEAGATIMITLVVA